MVNDINKYEYDKIVNSKDKRVKLESRIFSYNKTRMANNAVDDKNDFIFMKPMTL